MFKILSPTSITSTTDGMVTLDRLLQALKLQVVLDVSSIQVFTFLSTLFKICRHQNLCGC